MMLPLLRSSREHLHSNRKIYRFAWPFKLQTTGPFWHRLNDPEESVAICSRAHELQNDLQCRDFVNRVRSGGFKKMKFPN